MIVSRAAKIMIFSVVPSVPYVVLTFDLRLK